MFERERLNGHYGVTAFIIGNTLSSIPFLVLISLIPGALVYYLVGLHQGLQHFIFFISVLFVSVLLVESLMMIVASLVPNFLMGIIAGSGILGVMMLDGGFYRLPSDIPKPLWKYPLYYISFHRYAYQGLFKNEFESLTFTAGENVTVSGDEILRNFWQVEVGYSKWMDIGVLLGMVVLYRVLFLVIIKSLEKVKPVVAAIQCPQASFKFTKVSRSNEIDWLIDWFAWLVWSAGEEICAKIMSVVSRCVKFSGWWKYMIWTVLIIYMRNIYIYINMFPCDVLGKKLFILNCEVMLRTEKLGIVGIENKWKCNSFYNPTHI